MNITLIKQINPALLPKAMPRIEPRLELEDGKEQFP